MSQFQGYAQENRRDFDPIEAPDTSDRILKRAAETIRGIQEVRDADIANTSAYLTSFMEKMDEERNSESQYNKLLQLNFQTQKDNATIQAQKNAERKQALGSERQGIYSAIADLSKKAAGFAQQWQKDKFESDYNQEIIRIHTQGLADRGDAARYLADKHTGYNLQMTDISRLSGAAAAEANGADPLETAELRSRADGISTGTLAARMNYMAKKWPIFLRQSFLSDQDTEVMLHDGEGGFRKGVPSQAFSSKDRSLVGQQLLIKYLKDNGVYGKNPSFLADALMKMSEGTNSIVAATMSAEVTLQRTQQINDVEEIFRNGPGTSAQRFHSAHNYLKFMDPGQERAATERLFEIMKEVQRPVNGIMVGMSEEDVMDIFNSSFSHQPNKTIGELYRKEMAEVMDARNEAEVTNFQAETKQRELAKDEYLRNLKDAVLEDMTDPDDNSPNAIDLSDDNITLMQEQIRKQFPDPDHANEIVGYLETLRENTTEAVFEKPEVERIEEQIAMGMAMPDDIMQNPRLRDKTKRRLIKEAKATNVIAPSDDDITKFEGYVERRLRSRARAHGGVTTHHSLDDMRDYAIEQFKKRYMVGRNNGLDEDAAYQNAAAEFNEEYKRNDDGIYALLGGEDLEAYTREHGPFESGIFKNHTLYEPKAVTPETTALEIQQKLDSDPDSVNGRLVSVGPLKKVITQFNTGQTPAILPQIELIRKKVTKKDGSRYSYAELLMKQMEAHGLTPPGGIEAALELEDAIPARYTHLSLYPSATNSDIMLMSAGLPPTYNRNYNVSDLQTQALNVLAKYESSAYILDNDGGYNAMNQGGRKEGREAINPGHSTKILGRRLTDFTVAEIMQLQESGQLHAAGRYQFTNNTGTLSDTLKISGVPLHAKFDARTQDYLALALMRQRGIGPWVGPSDYATPQERILIETAMKQPIAFGPSTWQQIQNLNPGLRERKLAQ